MRPIHTLLPGVRKLPLVVASGLALAVACGTGGALPATPSPVSAVELAGEQDSEPAGLILRPDASFTLDQVVAAGWKKSKVLDAEALPELLEVWYGFYDRKDIEVRVYGSHEEAMAYGLEPAKQAVSRKYAATFNKGWSPTYGAYVVLGNLVMLCELLLADCENLVTRLE